MSTYLTPAFYPFILGMLGDDFPFANVVQNAPQFTCAVTPNDQACQVVLNRSLFLYLKCHMLAYII